MKITLQAKHDDGELITVETYDAFLEDILDVVRRFLMAASFCGLEDKDLTPIDTAHDLVMTDDEFNTDLQYRYEEGYREAIEHAIEAVDISHDEVKMGDFPESIKYMAMRQSILDKLNAK